jgi:superfamily II DNA or RNA helicase
VDLVLFDEGHHEPALRWSETVRKIYKPRIIFTATPFRNDLKLFDVDLQHAYDPAYDLKIPQSARDILP